MAYLYLVRPTRIVTICKSCRKKYSKWATPVSAKGVCADCFEAELSKQETADPPEDAADATCEQQDADTSSVGTGIILLGSVLIGLLLLLVVIAFIMTVYQAPRLSRLREAEVLVQLFANLFVAFYAFPAFKRTKKRAFLALGFAALIFAYGALFPVVALAALSARSRSQIHWYYAAIHASAIVGLVLYAYGAVSLARSAKASHEISV